MVRRIAIQAYQLKLERGIRKNSKMPFIIQKLPVLTLGSWHWPRGRICTRIAHTETQA